jgi:HD superfamily phosphohydrolase
MMARELGLGADDTELVRLAALLHDLGHGPFSHVSEKSLSRFADASKLPPGQKVEKIHELITAHLIRRDRDVLRILGADTCERVTRLLAEGYGHPAMKAIVSGPLDADKQDYLLRDSRYCGVTYGVYDIHQLHRALKLGGDTDERDLRIAPREEAAVEQFVLAKYYMTTNVYRHRVRLITDQMLTRAIALGIEVDNIEELGKLYRFDNTEVFVDHYIQWDDARFLREFRDPRFANTNCGKLVQRLAERRLLKVVFRDQLKQFTPGAREALLNLADDLNTRKRLEEALAEAINGVVPDHVNPHFVIVNPVNIKLDPTIARNDEASILVDYPSGPRQFETVSALFVALIQGFSEKFIEVYAPVHWSNPTEKKQLMGKLDTAIRKAVEEFFSPPPTEGTSQ